MNMQSKIIRAPERGDSIICAHELLVIALDIVDELSLPGQIGATIDHSIQMLRELLGPQHSTLSGEIMA